VNLARWHGATPPKREALYGETAYLEPLDPVRHGAQLYAETAGADSTWDYLGYGPFPSRDDFVRWLEQRAPLDDPLTFAIIDRATGTAQGVASFMRIDPWNGVIEIGHIWLSPRLQRTRQATEAIYIMSRYGFELGNRRLEWKCDALNAASRRAAERFGFVFEGVFRQHMVVKGRNRDTAWYSITDSEWPSRQAAFEAWLSPENFDTSGRQRRALAEFRFASAGT
jgi:RimJ/RimL family protein N-acetyltransferase